MEHFEGISLDTADHSPAKWLRYVDIFVVYSHGPARWQQFLLHLNSLRPNILFTMDTEINNVPPFLDVLVMKRGPKLTTNVYRIAAHMGRYLHFKSNHPHHMKRGVIRVLISRAKVIRQAQKDFDKETKNKRCDLMLNEYP
jgi:hypothetical protein